MYARVVTFHVRRDVPRGDAVALYHDLVEMLREMDGFRGSTFLLSEDASRGMSITYWRDQPCASQAGHKALPRLIERVRALVDQPPEIMGYEMIDHSADLPELAEPIR